MSSPPNRSVLFFEEQFRRQVQSADHALNPFEAQALPLLQGKVLDYGCGLGNLAAEAARRGCDVLAVDASLTAIERIRALALREALPLRAEQADLRAYRIRKTSTPSSASGC